MIKAVHTIRTAMMLLTMTLLTQLGWGQVSITNSTAITASFTGFTSASAGTAISSGNSPTNWTLSGSGSTGSLWQGTNQSGGTSGGFYANANLSFLGSSNASNGNATWLLLNNSGSTISGFTLSFTGRMWKSATNSPSVTVTWSNSSSITNPASGALANSLSSLTFNDATANISTGTTLSQTVSSLSIANGQYIFIRFIHSGGSSSDNLGWDDISFTPTLVSSTTNFYNTPNSDVTNIANWSTNTNGSGGTQPTNFTSANQVFNIANTGATMGSAWTVSGSNSKVVLGDGTNAVSFTIPSGSALTGTIDVANSGTLNISNTTNPTLGTLGSTNSTIVFNAAGAQTVPAASYANLTISTTTANATAGGAISASGTLTISSGSTLDMGSANVLSGAFTPAGTGTLKTSVPTATSATPIPASKTWTMTVQYASASAMTVLAGTYANLDISGGDRTLPSGTVHISGTYTPGNGTLIVSGNTINFSSASAQTIPAATYNAITNTGNGARTLANGTIKIAGTLTPGSGNYTIGTSLVEFNGSSNQTIPVLGASGANYYDLTYSGSAVGSIAGAMTIGRNLLVTSGTFRLNSATSYTLTVQGNLTMSGASSATIDMNAGNSGTSTLNLAGNFSVSGTDNFITTSGAVANGTIVFNGSAQSYSNTSSVYNGAVNFTVSNGSTLTLLNALDLYISNTAAYKGTLTISNGGTLVAGTYNIIYGTTRTGNAVVAINAGGTLSTSNTGGIEGAGTSSSDGTISTTSSYISRTYTAGAHYMLNGATATPFPTGTFGNPANLTINADVSLNRSITATGTLSLTSGTFTLGAYTFTLSGSTINRDGAIYTGAIDASNASATLAYSGTTGITFPASTFSGNIKNLTVSNTGSVTTSGDITVSGTLTFSSSGLLTTGINKVIVSGSVTRSSTGYVNGNLQKNVSTGTNNFEIGTATVYAPVNISMTGVSGTVTLTGKVTSGSVGAAGSPVHATNRSNHYWTFTKTGAGTFTSYTAGITITNTTNTGTVASYKMAKFDAPSTWSGLSGSYTSNIVTSGDYSSFSDFEVGEPKTPSVTTETASSIASTSVTLNGTVNDNGFATDTYFDWGTISSSYTYTDVAATPSSLSAGSGSTSISKDLTSLSVNTQYFFRAKASSTNGTTNGSEKSFYTLANVPNAPSVTSPANTTLDVSIDNTDGNPSTTQYAIRVETLFVQSDGSLGASAVWQTRTAWGTKTVTGLTGGTSYTFDIKARNGDNTETAFGSSTSGTTTSATVPVVTTGSSSSITNTSVTLAGNVTSDGGATLTAKGMVYAATSTNNDPILGGTGVTNLIHANTSMGSFTADVSSLIPATQYSFKAYASNSVGDSYGNVGTFYTLANEPSTQTSSVTFSSPNHISFTIDWTSGNGSRRAVFMKESAQGTITNPSDATAYTASSDWSSKGTQLGSSGYYCVYNGAGSSVSITNLSSQTRYFVQAFEYNSDGSVTAETINYFTSSGTGNPWNGYSLSSEPSAHAASFTATAASTTSLTLNFSAASAITNAAGYIILQKTGSSAPTGTPSDATSYAVGNTIGDGTVAALITSTATTSTTISSLSYATQYSFTLIPYNWNGSVVSTYNYKTDGTIPSATAATSTPAAPTVTSPTATSITNISATLGGNVTSDGGDPITERGIVWSETSTNSDPLINGTGVTKVEGTGTTGIYTVATTGITSGVSISYKAYAFNSTGTGYTSVGTFTTLASQPTTAATSMTFSNTTINSITVSWTNGNGTNRIVVARLSATTRVAPTNATGYAVNSTSFTDGTNATSGTGNVVIYNGNGSSVNVTGLTAGTAYAFDVYEYNGSSESANYLTSSYLTGAKTSLFTEPTSQASGVTFTNVSATGFTVNWTKGTDASNSLVIIKASGAVDSDPVDGTNYSAGGSAFGAGTQIGTGNYVVYRAQQPLIAITGLTEGITYHVAVYAFNGNNAGTENYLTASPATGSQTAQTPTFYSKSSSTPSALSNWSSTRDGSGDAPTSFTANAANFVIQNGHTMTTITTFTLGTSGSKLQIENGGVLSAGHGITIPSGATFQIDNGGKYVQTGGVVMSTIFGGTEVFASNSNFEFQSNPGSSVAPSSPGYGNLTINVTSGSGSFGWGANITAVQGNLTVLGTGTGSTRHAFTGTVNTTVSIGGDFIVSGGNFWLSSSTGTCTVNLSGNLKVNGGTLDLANSSGVGIINVAGDVSITSGTLTEGGSTTTSEIYFNKSGNQSFTSGGTILNAVNFEVASESNLILGTSIISGSGAFTLNSGGSLSIGSAAGITTSGATGNIQVSGSRTFSSSANYIYNGTTAQVTGLGLPSTVNNLSINNSAGVTLTSNISVAGTLTLSSGTFDLGTKMLTYSGNAISRTSGNIDADGGGGAGAITFTNTGSITLPSSLFNGSVNNLTMNGAGGVIAGSDLTITGTLALTSGALDIGAYGLTYSGSSITRSAGAIDGDGGTLAFTNSAGLTLPASVFTGSINNLTMNGAGGIILSSNLSVTGNLLLTAGILDLNTATLTYSGSSISRTSGAIDADGGGGAGGISFTNTSAVSIPASSFTGNINNWTMNGTGGVTINDNQSIAGTLTLTSGILTVGNNTITLTGSISGGGSSSYIQTNGTGKLTRNGITTSTLFPVGNAKYNPVTINNVNNLNWSVKISDGITPDPGFPATGRVDLIWDITPSTNPPSSATSITFQYDATSQVGPDYSSINANMQAFHRNRYDEYWLPTGNTAAADQTVPTATTVTITGLTSFSKYALSKVGSPLPVTLLSFSGYKDGVRNQLRWITVTETNNAGFQVERSSDGLTYQSIGFVSSQAIGGNSQAQLKYSFTDANPAGIKHYYRLRQVDIDGRSSLSNILLLQGEKPTTFEIASVFPNPTRGQITMLLSAPTNETVNIRVMDLTGRIVETRQVNVLTGNNSIPFDLSKQAKGQYLIQVGEKVVRVVRE